MKKIVFLTCVFIITSSTYFHCLSTSFRVPMSSFSLDDILKSAQASDGELPPGYILLEEWALKSEGYWEGEYWREPVFGCVDANDKCLNL